jgi:cytochrome c
MIPNPRKYMVLICSLWATIAEIASTVKPTMALKLRIHDYSPPTRNPTMKSVLFTVAALAAFAATPAMADEALAKSKNCMACHSVDKKVVGPAYKDVAKKFAGKADAQTTLATAIQKGSTGVWGAVPMPPNANVNADEAKKLAGWILSLK